MRRSGRGAVTSLVIAAMVLAVVPGRPAGAEGPEPREPADTRAFTPCQGPFPDVACGHPFDDEIGWAADEGLTTGYVDGTFRPVAGVSRQATAALLWRLEGSPAGPFPDPGYPDVPADHPFATAIGWATDAGLVGGYGDGTFRPAAATTRQALAEILWRLEGSPAGPFPDPGYPDVPADHPFATAIGWFGTEGLSTAYVDGTFRPAAVVTRQAAAAFLFRLSLWRVLDPTTADRCEFLDPAHCLLVWPSDHLTTAAVPTPGVAPSGTGRRLAIQSESIPPPAGGPEAGVPADPAELNRNDGFSPGTAVLTQVPDIDLDQTDAPPLTDLAESLEPDSPTVIIDATTGERHLHWAELDAGAAPEDQVLMLRPGVSFDEGHRYVVALRDLRDATGEVLEPNEVFRAYRDDMATAIPALEARRPAMEATFDVLAAAGVERDDLYLAWDFTVASEANLSERLLHIRDDAFDALGAAAPTFTVDSVTDFTPLEDDDIARTVRGTVDVPLYLTGSGAPGATFQWGPDGLPERNGTFSADYRCDIPHAASGATPSLGAVYGHGLLGTRDEVGAGNVDDMGDEHNVTFCAVDWIGMSTGDAGNVVAVLRNLSRFPSLADRVQQGILNAQFLARAIKHPDGFGADPAFQDGGGLPLVAPGEVVYDGNSQGGIIGGAATAISTEWTRAVLGVPGMNYSFLLRRSSDWPLYQSLMVAAYPDRLDQTIGLSMIQMLWDRAEANGYAHHLTDDTYPGTPAHQVLLHVAFTDFQVSMWSAEVMARTAGIPARQPALAPGRHPDQVPLYGIGDLVGSGSSGSALVYWDSGNPPPPTTNTPPTSPEFGSDPHGRPRSQVAARQQKADFFDGTFVDACSGLPCLAP